MHDLSGKPSIVAASPEALKKAARALQQGQLVAIPTETVYGLGAAISQEEALKAVFIYKQRPFEDPLIVHVLSADQAMSLWQLSIEAERVFQCLAMTFWPGPLTIVAKAQGAVSRLVCGGGDTVGVRSPQHPVARALIEATGIPIAAPSANLFGHVSPTRAQHVADDFYDRELLIVDGDDCAIGIESTVIQLDELGHLRLLRHGAISEDDLARALRTGLLPVVISSKEPGQISRKIEAPGQYLRHYAPHTPAWMVRKTDSLPEGLVVRQTLPLNETACLDFAGRLGQHRADFQDYQDLSALGSSEQAAQVLFQQLRTLELSTAFKVLLLPELDPHQPDQQAIYDRIFRACEGKRAIIIAGLVYLT